MACFSGANVAVDSDYTINIFTSSGVWTPTFSGAVEVMVVAGGGGGGMDMGGGGGAGGYLASTAYNVSAGTAYTIIVGSGGVGAPAAGTFGQNTGHQYNISATQGGNSIFGSLTALGGGYGGSSYVGYTPNYAKGGDGGSGGGSSGYGGNTGTNGVGTSGQGNRGGYGGTYFTGGGGGAGTSGADSSDRADGGAGVLNSILDAGYYWAGGGGGAGYSRSGGFGGIGGGGAGAITQSDDGVAFNLGGGNAFNNGENTTGGYVNSPAQHPGGNAGPNTGGGGGGGSHYNANNAGGHGGSGIVIIKYLKSLGNTTVVSGGTIKNKSLVASYDFGNRKCFSGIGDERCGNMTPAFNSFSGLTGTCTGYISANGKPGVHLTTIAGGGVNYWNANGGVACLPSTKYVVTARVKFSGAGPSANLFYIRQHNSGGAQVSEYGVYNGSQLIQADNGYYIAYAYFTTEATSISFYVHGYEYSGGIDILLEDVQCRLAGVKNYINSSTVNTDGTFQNAGNLSSDGAGSLVFNGSYISVPSLNLIRDFTLECWVKLTTGNPVGFFGQGPGCSADPSL